MNFQNKRGSIVYFSILILSLILVITLGLSNLLFDQIQITRGIGEATRAYYAAESGAEEALKKLLDYEEDLVTNSSTGVFTNSFSDNYLYEYKSQIFCSSELKSGEQEWIGVNAESVAFEDYEGNYIKTTNTYTHEQENYYFEPQEIEGQNYWVLIKNDTEEVAQRESSEVTGLWRKDGDVILTVFELITCPEDWEEDGDCEKDFCIKSWGYYRNIVRAIHLKYQ